MITSRRSLSQAAFAARIDNLTKAAIEDGATSFAALLHRLPGVYPTELLVSLDRLTADKMIHPAVAASVYRQAAVDDAVMVEGRSLLPLPHPLD
jgi:uncharacterized membrane protein affecting hemolysin expression